MTKINPMMMMLFVGAALTSLTGCKRAEPATASSPAMKYTCPMHPEIVRDAGFEAGALAGGFVHAVEHSAADAARGQTVTCIHGVHATAEYSRPNPKSERVRAG